MTMGLNDVLNMNIMALSINKCDCGVSLDFMSDLSRKVGDESVCDNCYFKELGSIVEENPIGHPRIHH